MLQNQANTSAEFKHFKTPEVPVKLICMDLVGPIMPVTSTVNRFILTCIDMLTGFTVAIPIKDKAADTVCDTYRAHIYCTFGGSTRMLTDNGTEFKNEQMDKLCAQLNIKRIYSPVYTPEANGRLEAWHHFFKGCIAKHICGSAAEWDEGCSVGSSSLQLLSMPSFRRITICTDVWQIPNHAIHKVVGTSSKVLGGSWRSSENGFVEKTLFTHSREHKKSKRRAKSRRNYNTEK